MLGRTTLIKSPQKFKDKSIPVTDYDGLSDQSSGLIDRAIVMHLLREGQFGVASAFNPEFELDSLPPEEEMMIMERSMGPYESEKLKSSFSQMYSILNAMKTHRNLFPAMQWAREHSAELEARGSNFEFELARLQFIWLFEGGQSHNGDLVDRQRAALAYARLTFGTLQGRYLREVQQLLGAMAFSSNLHCSPYKQIFHHEGAWEDVAVSFTREFCSLLGLSAESPLHIATTAGTIALPMLQKLQSIMKQKRTEWTTQHELPVCLRAMNPVSCGNADSRRLKFRYHRTTNTIPFSSALFPKSNQQTKIHP